MNRQRRKPQAERVEIALERGQVTTVLVGSVVAMGLVFLTGVVFGNRLATADGAPETGEQVAEVAAPAAQEAPELTFHDALTSRRGEERAPAVAPQPIPAPAAAESQASEQASKAPAEEQSDRAADAVPSPPPAAAPEPEATREQSSDPVFTVQVSSSRDETDTRRLAERLEEAGWDARVVAADIEGRGRWYRVRVGRYGSRQEAMRRQAELQQSFHLSGLVVSEG